MDPLFIPSALITLVFLLSGIEKIIFFARSTTKFSKKMSVPLSLAKLIISTVILLEISAPLVITTYLLTKKASLVPFFKPASLALIFFTIMATLMYHNPFKGGESYYAFMSNISTTGGLLAIYMLA